MLSRKPVEARLLSIKALLPRAAGWLWQALLLAAWSRGAMFGELSPFACAGFAAGLCADASPVAMLLGVCLASPWAQAGVRALALPTGCLIAWGVYLLQRALPEYPGLMNLLRPLRARLGGRDMVAALGALLGALLSAAAFSMGDGYRLAIGTANALIAMTVAPVLTDMLALEWKRSTLMPHERLSLVLGTAIFLLGIKRSPLTALTAPLAALCTLLASGIGAAQGAGMGVFAGSILAFAGDDPFLGASLGLCGLIAGAAAKLGRLWATAGFLLGNTITLTFGAGYAYGAMHPLIGAAVGTVYCAIPAAALDRLAQWFRPEANGCAPERLAARVCRTTQKRINALELVFEELAHSCGRRVAAPDEHMLIAQMRRQLCSGCEQYPHCWGDGNGRAGRLLLDLLLDTIRGNPLTAENVPPQIGRICRRSTQIPRRLSALLSDFERRRRTALERRSTGAALGGYYHQASQILGSLANRLARPLTIDPALAAQATAALERDGFRVADVLAMRSEQLQLVVRLRDQRWDKALGARAAACLCEALAAPLRAELLPEDKDTEMRFLEAPPYSAIVGYATRAGAPNATSGDAHLLSGMTGARILMALSDGMGSGERARSESEETIRLVKRFLLADVDPVLALNSINQLLLQRGGEEMYATCDLCILDLMEGSAECIKLGACHSYVLRKRALMQIEGGSLPLGILESISPCIRSVSLRAGDTVVLFSDGLADTASEQETAWLEESLKRSGALPPGKLCERLIEAASARPGARDDMTVLAARIVKTVL